jgi:hypothetical protein
MAQEADPPDQPIGSQVDRRSLTDAVRTPQTREPLDLLFGTRPVESGHMGEELGLCIDFGERLHVLRPPLPEEQPRRPQLRGDRAVDGLGLGEQTGQLRHDPHA